ncbi:MAG: helix-turn-helix domain-containing protein [Anaerovoracaceae bacterium]
MTYQEQVKAFERSLLCKALQSAPTKTEAAKLLGMTKQALNYRLDSLGMK